MTPIPFTVIQPTETRRPELPAEEAATSVVTATPGVTPSPTLPLPTGVFNDPQVGGKVGEIWTLADLRYGVHEDRLRLVLEMRETGETFPKYRVVEVSNAEVPFPEPTDADWGVARIDILVSDLYAQEMALGELLPIELSDDPVVTRIGRYPTADDAILGLSLGLKVPTLYEVYELRDPVRLVIDVPYP